MTATLTEAVTTQPRRRSTRRFAEGERPSRLSVGIVWIVMGLATLYFLVPVVWLVIAATKSQSDLFTTPGFGFATFHLWENVRSLSTYDGGIFWRWMLNSLLYSGVGSVLTMLLSAVTGYALAVFRFRGKALLQGAILASLLVPTTVLAQPTYVLLVHLGLSNNYLGVLLPSLVYPFGVMLSYITARSSVPTEIIEAARLDGASEARVFFSIAFRLMGTGLTTVLLFAFMGSWNNFLLPLLVLNDRSLFPVTLGLNGWANQTTSVAGLQILTITGALVSVIPIVAIFIALQRFWKSGVSAGGVRF
ncbi:MAG: carbohydrate ABC transporter permease [Rhodococcus sp. (in: high G+C Gram-positive bacteria)]